MPPEGSACKASQRLAADGADTPVFALTLLSNARAPKGFVAIVSLPLGVYLAPGLELRIDKGKPYKILFETCNQAGCHAGFPLDGPVLAAFRRGRQAEFRVWTGKAKPTPVLVSLTGLAPALTALSEAAR